MIDYNFTPINDTELLDFGSDLHLRRKWFLEESFSHPAKLHLGLLHWLIEKYTRPGDTVADPMCGIGGILYAATLQRDVIAREIEPCWLEIAHRNAAHIKYAGGLFTGSMSICQADARQPWDYQADHIIFSPPYGNEASTTGNASRGLLYRLHAVNERKEVELSDRWQRLLDKQTDGAKAALSFFYGSHPSQIGHYRGQRYLDAMSEIYGQAYNALRTGGFMVLVVKDHIYQGERIEITTDTVEMCEHIGFSLYARHQRRVFPLSLWQRRRKEQGLPVVEEEDVLVFRKQEVPPETK